MTVPADVHIHRLQAPEDAWKRNLETTRTIGDEWLRSACSALAEVPSAIMPETRNYLLNPEHPEAARIRIADITKADFDPRRLHPPFIRKLNP